MLTTSRLLAASVLSLSFLAASLGAGCAAPHEPEENVAANDDELSGSQQVGATLIATSDVNLRASASTSGKVLLVVPSGASVTVVAADPQNGFYEVSYQGTTGWSSGTYYKFGSSPPPPVTGPQAGATLVATTSVNLRASASTSAKVLEVVPEGASVTLVAAAASNGFYEVTYQGTTGWSSAQYYKAQTATQPTDPPPATGGDVTATELLALTANCAQLSGTTKFAKDSGGSSTVPVCGLKGAVYWNADMDVDCDGGQGAACKADPDYQSDTSAVDSKGKALDASTLPYVVVPQSSNGFNYTAQGLKLGSVVAVIYKNKVVYGILGDTGPHGVIGEASYAMAVALGIPPSPVSGGVDSGVTYIAFTGSSAVVTKKEDNAEAVKLGQAAAAQLVENN